MKFTTIVIAFAVCSIVSKAQSNFTVDGTLIIRNAGVDPRNALNAFDKIRFTGPTSDYGIAIQDGNGRVNHYWNSSGGASPLYLVSNEEAGRIRLHPTGGDLFTIYNAPVGVQGAPITWVERFSVKSDGRVGIGSTVPDAKLTVNGTIHASEVKIDLSVPGPDYVFEKDYKLTSLEEIKNYIDQNKHLPEVPSAKEMERNGVQLGEMNMLLLKKIEELTLYVIEQHKKMEEMKKENDSTKTQLKAIQSEINQLKK